LVGFGFHLKMNSSRGFFKYIYLIFGVLRLLGVAFAFSVVPYRRSSTTVMGRPIIQALHVVADPPMRDDKQKKSVKESDRSDWILAEKGRFFPNLRSRYGLGIGTMRQRSENRGEQKYTSLSTSTSTSVPSKIVEVVDIHQYKTEVADVQDQLVCVRFYAPWCKSCKAIEAPFRRLPQVFAGYPVKFVECPVTKDNAYLHKGLGVSLLPFGHIYHPQAGLVEERRISKHAFEEFKKVLWTYAQGECPVTFDDQGNSIPQ